MNERAILLALAGVGSVLAVASSIPRPDAGDGPSGFLAERPVAIARDAEPTDLEPTETLSLSPPPIREVVRRPAPVRVARPRVFPKSPVELRNLPESTWQEMSFKRDAIEDHLRRSSRSEDPELLALAGEVGRLIPLMQERAIAEYHERKAELLAGP